MADRKMFSDSVTPLPPQEGLAPGGLMVQAAQADHRLETMKLLFSLDIPADRRADLEAKVARGEVVPLHALQNDYMPAAADVDALVNWLKTQGFTIDHVTPDRTGVYASATVAQIEQSLAVTMVRVTKGGLTYTAARDAPSLPADVGKGVHAIIGLQPFRQANKHAIRRMPRGRNRMEMRPNAAPAPNVANAPPYLASEILKAYGADGLGVSGKGQTIAILIDTLPADSDLQAFWARNGIGAPLPVVDRVNVGGAALPPLEGEETLDAEWSSGIAPGAKIRIYATGTLAFVDLDLALDRIIADLAAEPGMRQLSISLGLGETYMGGPQGEVAVQHQKFLRLAAAGVNVFVSSGDAGSNPNETGHQATGPTQTEYESSDPCVVGVGGTSLSLAPNGAVNSETAWPSSGGGESVLFDRPAWQRGPGVPPGAKRLVPDVSLTADPDNGALVILNGGDVQYGGTSWSAPVWAGFCALINEARSNAQMPPLPFLNPLIYPLIGSACFRDISVGSNGAFNASPGYDMVTGVGVPNVRELIRTLTQPAAAGA